MPVVRPISSTMDGVTGFTGYNHNLKIGNTEFYDQTNICGDNLPVITQRKRRGIVRSLTKANGIFANDKLGWVDGTDLYYDGDIVGAVADSVKTIVRMGAYVLVFPDKMCYNTDTGVYDSLEASYASASNTVSALLSKADGTPYTYTVSATAPETPVDGAYWLDTSGNKNYLRQYVATTAMWTAVPTVYVKISATGIGAGFSEYDGVTIAGMDNAELNGKFFIASKGADYIVVIAIISTAITDNTTAITVKREVPDMVYFTEFNNRIWGCNSAGNEIYACALGDPKNWNQFMGLTTDSYAVSIGSAGSFTGAVTHLGNVLFFKEHTIHQIMGTLPSNFSESSLEARGVANGSSNSLKVVNEVLYYNSMNDVCAYGQSLPVSISEALGKIVYSNAVSGACANKYYICLEDSSNAHVLFTYDVDASLWCKEDDINVRWFVSLGNELYFIVGNTIYSANGTLDDYGDSNAKLEPAVPWMLETGDMGLDAPFNKFICGIQLYASVELGTTIRLEIQYDAIGPWNEVYRASPLTPRSLVIPITTKRCRTIKLRIQGTGGFKLWSLVQRTMAGSDL